MAVKKPNQRRPVRVIEGDTMYLLQMAPGKFFFRESGEGRPLCVEAPSVAAHLSYKEADRLCTEWRAAGYQGCVVTNIFGQVVDATALEDELRRQQEAERKFWGSE